MSEAEVWLVVAVDVDTGAGAVDCVDGALAAALDDAGLLDELEAPQPAASNPMPTPATPIAMRV